MPHKSSISEKRPRVPAWHPSDYDSTWSHDIKSIKTHCGTFTARLPQTSTRLVDIFKLACFKLLYKYENRKLPSYFNGMFVLQHDNVVIRPQRIHRTPQLFNITEEILPYNNVCNLKIKHTNSKFCHICIIYKIPELIKDNYFPKKFLEKMYTHSYSGFTKYAKTYTIRNYKATCKIQNCYVCNKITNTAVEQFPARIY